MEDYTEPGRCRIHKKKKTRKISKKFCALFMFIVNLYHTIDVDKRYPS